MRRCSNLFCAPTGLAVGLALEEQRYAAETTIRPKLPVGPPLPGRAAARDSAMDPCGRALYISRPPPCRGRARGPPAERSVAWGVRAIHSGDRVGTLLELNVEEGASVLVEVDDGSTRPVTRGGRPADAVIRAGESLEQVVGRLGPAIRGIVSELRAAADWPDEVEVEFSVKLSSDANVIIARAGGEANFKIALRWSRKEG
jgi:Trypsin-co-occurring domain 1